MVKNKKINTTERVKGNMKPSSSSFAADLLTKEIGFNTGFSLNINFNTFTSEDKEKTNAMAIESANLDQELIVNLKKLSKRNSVTKVKALQDIYNKIVTIKEEEMEIFLNVYVPQFQKFVFDLERKVRSLNLLIFQTIVDKINRKIRPHLKQLLPSWLAAFFDNKEQAELAKKLFEVNFLLKVNKFIYK
ncbi:hypothetical protein K502DRAFT_223170 [Neoconidiobolus thromboides FSU 785]|nr:hypothetical protein K502DRAFT_223170 [Neoconidiobolus thromboides FSU 785]